MKVRSSLVAGGLASLLVVLAGCGGGDDDASRKVGSAVGGTGVERPAGALKVGDIVKVGDSEVIVHAVKDPLEAKPPPDAGSRYVGVEVELKNLSSAPQTYSSFGQFELKNSTGQTFDPVVLRGLPPPVGGEAPPGGSRRGQVAFAVPQDSQGLYVIYKDRGSDKGGASIYLT